MGGKEKQAPPPDFGPPDWLSIDETFARFLKAARDDPLLAVRDLQRALENGRLKSGYVRMPMRYRDGEQRVWIPENEENGLLSSQFWRTECEAHAGIGRVRCIARAGKEMVGRFLFFVRHADLDAILPPTPPPEAGPRLATRTSASVWAKRIIDRMKGDGAIPEGITKKGFAEMVAQRMQEEAAADPLLGKPHSAKHISNLLKQWGLWPL